MPCCNDSEEIQSYIKEFVIGYFGYTYIKELLLGGIAQQTITITEENRRSLVKNGFSKTENGEYSSSALGIFKIKAGFKVTDEFNESKLAIFSQYSQQSSVVTFGGSTTLQSIETWSSTVPGNPAAIKLKTEPLVNLLTERTFPGDPNIAAKQALIQSAVTKYITKEVFCYNKCSYPNGVCPPTSNYFGFAKCVCTSGYTGYDCSKPKYVPTGILAQSEPGEKCLQGNTYFKQLISSYDTSCFLGMCDTTYNYWQGCHFSNYQLGMAGGTANTLCGISYGDLTILCDGMNPGSEPCPTQYTRINTGTDFFWTCVKQSSVFSDDLPGTLCGLHSRKDDGKHIACGGFYPGAGKCPTGYTLRQGVAHSRGGGFVSTCSKD
ncbi:unnamed protein product [Adineta steineri]|uniref:Uncharacterized protein n=1 Tax=Adineta steineri TaxID=433720 RepID=A0A815K0Q1_9BILA|nr:unnamed protein product [Adineta steineri]CAF1609715.1 unnamed protein product [Adineta steineri]